MILILFGIAKGHYEVGLLILFDGYFRNITESVRELAEIAQQIAVARIGVSRMEHILKEPVRIDTESGKVNFPRDWKKIELRNISFSYKNRPVLDQVSFTVHRGERIGIVGLSGAGKSTLFKLLLKEYEDFKGDIYIDDVKLKDVSKSNFFKFVSVVLQDTEVFNFSLKENITIANPAMTKSKMSLERAVKTAHITDFMDKLPQGLETVIGEKGVRLSGGERQRLGIARAIYKNPQLLLLDEATSHLDVESEDKIRESLHEFFQQVTAIVIAHRLSTVKEMDRILVLEDGHIIEQGSFQELQKAKGRFYDLWEKQRL